MDENNRQIAIAVINRSREQDIATELQLAEHEACGGVVYQLNADDVDARNSFERPDAVAVVERVLAVHETRSPMQYVFPAHSLTFFRLELDDRLNPSMTLNRVRKDEGRSIDLHEGRLRPKVLI